MKLFLSDIHLGNILFEKSRELCNLLISSKYTNVYILGDILDIWSMDLEHILEFYNDVITTINSLGSKCVILKGNHDPDFDTLCKVFNNVTIIKGNYNFALDNKATILLHGDEFDSSGSVLSCLFRCLAPIQWIFTKAGMSFAYRLRDWYYKQKHGSDFYRKLIIGTEKNTIEKYKEDYEIIIMGHTHMAKIVREPSYTYVNCGTALDEASAIEYDNSEFRLVRY